MRFIDYITVELVDSMGDDQMICHAARVSTKGSRAELGYDAKKDEGLINYLMKHKHGTPFEHGSMIFRVHAPIFVWREWHRHRIGFSYNEESGRYKKLEPVFYVANHSRPSTKTEDWKPGRPKFLPTDSHTISKVNYNLQRSYELAYEEYEDNIAMGVDPGLARACLPVGIYSSCYVTCNPRSLMAFLSLRTHGSGSYPLYEIELAAQQCEGIFANLFPVTYSAWVNNGRIAP